MVRVSFSGGLLGFIFGSYRGKLEKVISDHNRRGWHVIEVTPDNLNLLLILLRLILLICTLGLWTLSSSIIVIFERERRRDENSAGAEKTYSSGLVATR